MNNFHMGFLLPEYVKLLGFLDKRRVIHKLNHEYDQYQAHSCLGLLKNKPQINADERRLIKSEKEISLPIFISNLLEFFENDKLLRGSYKYRLIKLDDDPCLSILNSILSRHLFNRTYSSHDYCN
ncbi:hypothetical protein METP2_01008 [Methanosarcinales archaeon]|nr:hypothetical protein METP2_01008 [Methanosarcinales archaeon]